MLLLCRAPPCSRSIWAEIPGRTNAAQCVSRRQAKVFSRVTVNALGENGHIDYEALSRAEPVYLVSTQEIVYPVTDLLSSTRRSVLFLGRSMG